MLQEHLNNYYNNTSNTVKYSVKNCKYWRNAASAFKPVGVL